MIIRVIDISEEVKNVDYLISAPIGQIIKKHFGRQVEDPIGRMGDRLYKCYMNFCVPISANQEPLDVKNPDIIFFLV